MDDPLPSLLVGFLEYIRHLPDLPTHVWYDNCIFERHRCMCSTEAGRSQEPEWAVFRWGKDFNMARWVCFFSLVLLPGQTGRSRPTVTHTHTKNIPQKPKPRLNHNPLSANPFAPFRVTSLQLGVPKGSRGGALWGVETRLPRRAAACRAPRSASSASLRRRRVNWP